jgi:hypothetical protein
MAAKKSEPRNLYALKPLRLVEWESDEHGRVTILIPKFSKGPLARWLQPRLRRPIFRIKLDEYGSFVWLNSDGKKDVRQIGEEMKARFGEVAEPVYDRIGRFLQQLENSKFIGFDKIEKDADKHG